MKWFFLTIIFGLISFAIVTINLPQTTSINDAPQVLAATTTSEDGDAALTAVNNFRLQNGLDVLQPSSELNRLVQYRVTDMVTNQYYSHKSPDGTLYNDVINNYLPDSMSSCENLQLQNSANIQDAVDAWIKSPSHRRCLLNPKTSKAGIFSAYYDGVSYDLSSQAPTYIFVFIGSN